MAFKFSKLNCDLSDFIYAVEKTRSVAELVAGKDCPYSIIFIALLYGKCFFQNDEIFLTICSLW